MILNESNLKVLAKGLRRELKQLGVDKTHNQMLELIAKSLGYPSLAALLATGVKPMQAEAAGTPAVDTPAVPKADPYRLFNDGELDVVEIGEEDKERILVTGLEWDELEGTSDSILATARVSHVYRGEDGQLEYDNAGESTMHWDTQEARSDERGATLWNGRGVADVAEDGCVLSPYNASQDGAVKANLSVRETLVDAVFRYLRDHDLIETAKAELGSTFQVFYLPDHEKDVSAMQRAQRAAGFGLHPREAVHLMALLERA